MAADRHPDRLNSDEVALVLRRAADLEAQADGGPADAGFDAAAVEEAALEVGLSPAAVRQAMAELQTGDLTPAPRRGGRGAVARTSPSVVQVARLLPCPPPVVHASAEQYLRRQTFEVRRRQDQVVLYRQRRDLTASLRRGLDVNGAIKLGGVSALTMTATPVEPDRCMVRIVAELRGRAVINTLANLGGFTAALIAAVPGVVIGGAPGAVGAGLVAGAGVTVGGLTIGHTWWRRRRQQTAEALDGFLDSLERRPALGA